MLPSMSYQTLVYAVDGAIASITLARPEELNTIVPPMPDEIEAAVAEATRDDTVKVIAMSGYERSRAAQLGDPPAFFLQKPFRSEDLLDAVAKLFAR